VRAVLESEDAQLEAVGFQHVEDNLYKCLLALDSAGSSASEASSDLKRLPAIVFHLTVRGCNRLLARLVSDLESHQNAYEVCADVCLLFAPRPAQWEVWWCRL
jgi:hypothetical protein